MNMVSPELSQSRDIEKETHEIIPEGHLTSGTSEPLDPSECKSSTPQRAVKNGLKRPWKERRVERGIGYAKKILSRLNLERFNQWAIKYYRIAIQSPLYRGKKLLALAYAVVVYILKEKNYPLTLKEILADSIYPARLVLRYYNLLLGIPGFHNQKRDPRNIIVKVCSEMGLDQTIVSQATTLLGMYAAHDSYSGQDPKGIVAACIYLATIILHVEKSQYKISKGIGVSETTLRKRFYRLKHILDKFYR